MSGGPTPEAAESAKEPRRFPAGFLWGAATSAYQIEGSPLADGAGPSIWHRFSHTPGRIVTGETADVACDHYRRWAADVELMRQLGLSAYRFSISWSRVLPEGTGRVNPAGLGFYDALVDRLLAAGITPLITLYHWDLPAALDDRGGWRNPDVAHWFADYARLVVGRLGDRVRLWATLNEPWVVVDAGYLHGVHAPGQRCPFAAARAAVNLLRAHGAAVQAARAEGASQVGLVVNLEPKYAASQADADVAAAGRAEAYWNRQFLDPVFFGHFPEELPAMYGEAWPAVSAQDLALIRTPVDFIGVNYYTRGVVRHDPTAIPDQAGRVRQEQALHTAMEWEVFPAGLEEILVWVSRRYGRPAIYVTENGAAFPDPP
ncbi:MAG: family 1 glycosylhydrolase, partial [Acidobacteriota bacterium]